MALLHSRYILAVALLHFGPLLLCFSPLLLELELQFLRLSLGLSPLLLEPKLLFFHLLVHICYLFIVDSHFFPQERAHGKLHGMHGIFIHKDTFRFCGGAASHPAEQQQCAEQTAEQASHRLGHPRPRICL